MFCVLPCVRANDAMGWLRGFGLGLVALAIFVGGGCVESSAQWCGQGDAARLCGTGAVCLDNERCELATNVAACADLVQGAECVLDGRELGHCRSRVCARTFCGDRVVDQGEVCDDGNARDGDGCSADCIFDGILR